MGKGQRLKAEREAERTRAESIAAARGGGARGGGAKRSLPVFWIVFGGVIALGLVVLIVSSVGGGGSNKKATKSNLDRAYSTITKSGSSLPAYTGTGMDSAVGKVAPVVTGSDYNKKPIAIGGPGALPTMAMFVAHWCPHCQAEIPRLTDYLAKKGMPKGVRLVTVATASGSSKPNYPPMVWLTNEKWPAPVMLDDEVTTALTAYGNGGFPYFVELDKSGKVVKRLSGELDTSVFADELKSLAATAKP